MRAGGMMQIRGATTDDCRGIAKVQVDSYRTSYQGILPSEYLDSFSYSEQESDWCAWIEEHPDDVLYVAEADKGGVIAYGLARPGITEIPPYDSELIALHVRAREQRMGIGRLMLWTIAKELHRAHCRSMLLWVLEANRSTGFYEHLGARRLDESKLSSGSAVEIAYGWPEIEQIWMGKRNA